MKSFLRYWKTATFKREFALLAFATWFFGVHLPCTPWFLRDVPVLNAYNAYYTIASTLIWGYIASAFGMDFWLKQVKGLEVGPTTTAGTGSVATSPLGTGVRTS